MAIDSAEKRKSISGINYFCPGVTPNSSQDAEWRQEVGYSYSGIAAASSGTGTFFANRHNIERGMVASTAAEMGGVLIE